MLNGLLKVINSIIKKKHPSIYSVHITPMGTDFYVINYHTKDELPVEDRLAIMEETTTLFKMLGPEKFSDIAVYFEYDL